MLPSACAGWTVRDVMGHMACTLHGVIDPAFLPDMSGGTERGMEPAVAERRTWPIEQVIDEYETYSEQAADVFASVQDPPMSEDAAPDGRPRHAPDVDPAEHVLVRRLHAPAQRHPRRRTARSTARNPHATRNACARRSNGCSRDCRGCAPTRSPVSSTGRSTLTLDGPGGGTWTIAPGGDDGRVVVTEGADPDAAATACAAPTTTS